MAQRSVLREEIVEHQRAIARLLDEIKTIQNFIAADERNIQHAVETVRVNARLSLENYRNSLTVKQLELQSLQQAVQTKQALLTKLDEVARKEQEVLRLEQEKQRITNLYDKAQADLSRMADELANLTQPRATVQQASMTMPGGQQIAIPQQSGEILIGCTDAADGIFPAIDLTPFGGSASGVSRRHASLSFQNGQWTITDEDGTNGTFLNGMRLPPHVPRTLSNGAALRFGGVDATFTLGNAVPAAGKTTRLS